VSVYRFIAAEKAAHSIAIMCRVFEVSRSGYHAWTRRSPMGSKGDCFDTQMMMAPVALRYAA
jgi:hypothetical protein